MGDWSKQPQGLTYLQGLLNTLATLRRIELLSKLKRAHSMYTTQIQLDQAREQQRALTQQLAEARANTQGALTQELHEARNR